MVFLSSFYCGLGEIKRPVFCFTISVHWISCLSRAAVLYTCLPHPPMPHGMHLLWKWNIFQFCFKNSSIFLPISGDHRSIGWLLAPDFRYHCITSINHHSILAPWSCLLIVCLCSPLALPAWHSPNLVWHLLLRVGRGPRQAYQFFHELGAACNQQTVKPCSKASEVPSMVEWGTEPREVYK